MKKCNRVGVDVSAKELVVAIEASGRKEAPIVLANDAEGHFARASLQRSKTDRLDAETILEFAIRMPFEPRSTPKTGQWSTAENRPKGMSPGR